MTYNKQHLTFKEETTNNLNKAIRKFNSNIKRVDSKMDDLKIMTIALHPKIKIDVSNADTLNSYIKKGKETFGDTFIGTDKDQINIDYLIGLANSYDECCYRFKIITELYNKRNSSNVFFENRIVSEMDVEVKKFFRSCEQYIYWLYDDKSTYKNDVNCVYFIDSGFRFSESFERFNLNYSYGETMWKQKSLDNTIEM